MQVSLMISRIVVGCGQGSRALGNKSSWYRFESKTCLPLFGLVIMVDGIERNVLKAKWLLNCKEWQLLGRLT